MSKNLTNVQLNIITTKILSELRNVKITDKVKKEFEKQIAEDIDYQNLLKKAKRYEETVAEIERLRKEQELLRIEVQNAFGNNLYFSPTIENVNSKYKSKIDEELNKLLPSRFDIESDIVLGSINGSKDLISEILKKYT